MKDQMEFSFKKGKIHNLPYTPWILFTFLTGMATKGCALGSFVRDVIGQEFL
jgi:hypothetical protein